MGNRLIGRIVGVMVGVFFMGFSISWLVPCGFGTDGFTAMNLAISDRIGLSFGTWQALLNILLFLIVLATGRRYIGIGTFANMLLIGYICDFFTWVWGLILPEGFFVPLSTRVVVAVPALVLFVVSAAIYMDMDLGASPCDALPFILHKAIQEKVPFSVLRVVYDLVIILLGYAFGAPFAAVTLAMAFLLGPAVSLVGKWLDCWIFLRPASPDSKKGPA